MKEDFQTLFQNSLSSVDDLIKKHDGFAKTLEAQEEKIDTLEQLAQALLAQEHYASDHIRRRCQGVLDRRDKVKQVRLLEQFCHHPVNFNQKKLCGIFLSIGIII